MTLFPPFWNRIFFFPPVGWWEFSSISILLFSLILLISFTRNYPPTPPEESSVLLGENKQLFLVILQGNPLLFFSSTFYPFRLKAGKVLCGELCWLIKTAVTHGRMKWGLATWLCQTSDEMFCRLREHHVQQRKSSSVEAMLCTANSCLTYAGIRTTAEVLCHFPADGLAAVTTIQAREPPSLSQDVPAVLSQLVACQGAPGSLTLQLGFFTSALYEG